MYSDKIREKLDAIFSKLERQAETIVNDSYSSDEAIKDIMRIVGPALMTNSKFILSDMIYELSNQLLETKFFEDIERQNKFFEINLRHEILSKYQFDPNVELQYQESSKTTHAIIVGGATGAIVGIAEVGIVLATGLSVSSLVPIAVGALFISSIGVALMDYYILGPKRDKKSLIIALKQYFVDIKEQLLKWFDEVERYFNKRVEEIKLTM